MPPDMPVVDKSALNPPINRLQYSARTFHFKIQSLYIFRHLMIEIFDFFS
jgi:hypothetical protein